MLPARLHPARQRLLAGFLLALVALVPLGPRAARAQGAADGAGTTPATKEDSWTGRDKLWHFGGSVTLAAAGYAAGAAVLPSSSGRLAAGAGLALSLGVAKELLDARTGGTPSWRDLAWDGIGTAAGLALCLFVDVVLQGRYERAQGTRASAGDRTATGLAQGEAPSPSLLHLALPTLRF